MTAADQLLADIADALSVPFANPVNIHGIVMSRDLARAMERGLLRERKFQTPRPRAGASDRAPSAHHESASGPVAIYSVTGDTHRCVRGAAGVLSSFHAVCDAAQRQEDHHV